jgi:hypothetical protein
MATRRHMFTPERKESKISIKFVRYNNQGSHSKIIE